MPLTVRDAIALCREREAMWREVDRQKDPFYTDAYSRALEAMTIAEILENVEKNDADNTRELPGSGEEPGDQVRR